MSITAKATLYCLLSLGLGLTSARAQTYPDKPIHIVVPYAAGGGVDNITRVVSERLAARLGQVVVIDNRPGANGNIGANLVAKANPDGYTLLMGSSFLATNRASEINMTYDSATDLLPVARAGRSSQILLVPSTSPAKTVADLVTYLRANPTTTAYGTVGTVSPTALIFIKNTATTPVQILYKGGSLAMPDLISGRLTFMIPVASEGIPHVSSGKLRALAVTGNQRMKALPEVPTMQEAGIANLDGIIWWGLFAPAKTPPAIIERVSKEMLTLLDYPEVATAFAQLGIEPAPLSAQQFATFYQTEIQTYAQVAKEFNLMAK